MIISAIQLYQTLFSDPITVSIRFRLSAFDLDGIQWATWSGRVTRRVYPSDWNVYITALKADGKTRERYDRELDVAHDSVNNQHSDAQCGRPGNRLDHTPAMFADGSLGVGGPYDGIITINSAQPLQFTRPVAAGNFDATNLH